MVLVQQQSFGGRALPQLGCGMSARARAVVAAMQVRLAQVGGLSALSNDSDLFREAPRLGAKARQDYIDYCVPLPCWGLEFEVRL